MLTSELEMHISHQIAHTVKKNREEHCVTAVEQRPEGKRRPGRPKTKWRRMIERWQYQATVRALAANRSGWKEDDKALRALLHGEKIYGKVHNQILGTWYCKK